VHDASLVDSVRSRSGPLSVQAQQLYRSLSDADATAAAAFLSNGVEPPALRSRYETDIAAATGALSAAASAGDSDQEAVRQVAAALPVYTGLVESARAYNRMNLPLGAAYLREASYLMRDQLLPAAEKLYLTRVKTLADDRGAAASFPWLALLLIVLTLVGICYGHTYLNRRTHRLFNVGVTVAGLAAVVLLAWATLSWAGVHRSLSASQREGSAQVEQIAGARILALQARADEALILVAHGNGADFEKDYQNQLNQLTRPDGTLATARDRATDPAVRGALADALAQAQKWKTVHAKLTKADTDGQYTDAVALAIGDDPGGARAAFNALDADLQKGITQANTAFDDKAKSAGSALTGTGVGFVLLTLVLLAGVVAGIERRIAEYR
jgi:hypothetical protein